MPDFITLSCPSCGNKLQITDDIDRFACAACGNEYIVNRSGGDVFFFSGDEMQGEEVVVKGDWNHYNGCHNGAA
jgi:DNA-directed RNA polymerase subunit M/transcription elongation factor TFIIS